MSGNLELVRSIFAEWELGEFGRADWAHPDIEFVLADGPAPGSWHGRSGMINGWRDFLSAWQDWRGEAEEYLELGGGRVLALILGSGRGKLSGLDAGRTRAKGANLFLIERAQVKRLVVYFDRANAFTELGLTPDRQP